MKLTWLISFSLLTLMFFANPAQATRYFKNKAGDLYQGSTNCKSSNGGQPCEMTEPDEIQWGTPTKDGGENTQAVASTNSNKVEEYYSGKDGKKYDDIYDCMAANNGSCELKKGTKPTSGKTGKTGKTEVSDAEQQRKDESSCDNRAKIALITCGGAEFSSVAGALVSQYQASKQTGDLKSTCSAIKGMSALQMTLNGTFIAACMAAKSACTSACGRAAGESSSSYGGGYGGYGGYINHYRQKQLECESYTKQIMTTIQQIGISLQANRSAALCEQVVTNNQKLDPCGTASAVNDPKCPALYCTQPGRSKDPVCPFGQIALNCKDPALAGSPMCGGGGGGPGTPVLPPNNGNVVSNNGGGGSGFPQVNSNTVSGIDDLPNPPNPRDIGATNSKPLTDSPGQGGGGAGSGGFGAGGAGSGFAGNPNGGGGKGGPKDPEVYLGADKAGSGDGGGGGGGGYGEGQGYAGGQGNGREEKFGGFDLSKYLPGGNKGASRNPAAESAALLQAGITDANGLSNWEKVTRKMQEKKPEMKR